MISIIIPAHNEEGRLEGTLEGYLSFFSERNPEEFEIIVVPNGCADRTNEIAKNYSIKFPQLKCKTIEGRAGKGGAIMEGFKAAKGDIVSYVDADGATSPGELYRLIMEMEGYEGVIGSRWMKESSVLVKQPLSRRVASRGFNLMVRILLGLPFKDTQCGAKVFRKQAINTVAEKLGTTNFAFDIDLLYRLKEEGYRIKEVPIAWKDQNGSTLNLRKTIPTMFLSLVRLRMLNGPLNFLVRNRFSGYVYGYIWGEESK